MRTQAKASEAAEGSRPASRLGELARLFLKLGTIGFGGPAAHIALMEREVVGRRRWLTREEFLDLVGATNLIPGPNSTELAIHIGRIRAGVPGLVVAGAAFILPAFFIVGALGWVYQRFGSLPEAGALLRGVKPVMVMIVVQALVSLGRSAVKSVPLAVAGVVAVAVTVMRVVDELTLLAIAAIGAALIAWLSRGSRNGSNSSNSSSNNSDTSSRRRARGVPVLSVMAVPAVHATATATAGATAAAAAAPVALWPLFLVFAKAGSLLFGSGYVLLAFLQADLVERLGWLTRAQLLDAIVAGQITPGPVFTTATFIGYQLAGWPGAVVATVGIFAPAFVFVAASGPIIPALRRSRVTAAVLDAINVASLALMTGVTVLLARDAITGPLTLAIAAAAALLLVRFRVEPTLLIAAGGVIGVLFA
jgi:chromate transporter